MPSQGQRELRYISTASLAPWFGTWSSSIHRVPGFGLDPTFYSFVAKALPFVVSNPKPSLLF